MWAQENITKFLNAARRWGFACHGCWRISMEWTMDDLPCGTQRSHESPFHHGFWSFSWGKGSGPSRKLHVWHVRFVPRHTHDILPLKRSFRLSSKASYCHPSGFVVLKALLKSCWRFRDNVETRKTRFFFVFVFLDFEYYVESIKYRLLCKYQTIQIMSGMKRRIWTRLNP